MMSTLKMLGALAIVCMAAFGLMLAFGVVTVETVTANAVQVLVQGFRFLFSGPEMLVRAIGRSEQEMAQAAAQLVETEGALRALEQFLADPLRTIGALPPAVRGQVLELAQATAGGLRISIPRRLLA